MTPNSFWELGYLFNPLSSPDRSVDIEGSAHDTRVHVAFSNNTTQITPKAIMAKNQSTLLLAIPTGTANSLESRNRGRHARNRNEKTHQILELGLRRADTSQETQIEKLMRYDI